MNKTIAMQSRSGASTILMAKCKSYIAKLAKKGKAEHIGQNKSYEIHSSQSSCLRSGSSHHFSDKSYNLSRAALPDAGNIDLQSPISPDPWIGAKVLLSNRIEATGLQKDQYNDA